MVKQNILKYPLFRQDPSLSSFSPIVLLYIHCYIISFCARYRNVTVVYNFHQSPYQLSYPFDSRDDSHVPKPSDDNPC